MENKCRFCKIIAGSHYHGEVDRPFFVNDEFIAISSIGALVEGWTLVLSKKHQFSMRTAYRSDLFDDFLNRLLPVLINHYGSLIAFEHGANKEGSITACGTDHAHLHLVPSSQSLLGDMQKSGLLWEKCRVSEISTKSGVNEYLFYYEIGLEKAWKDPLGYLHVLKQPVSQYFRQAIARQKGLLDVSDYRKFPHIEIARQTQRTLAELVV